MAFPQGIDFCTSATFVMHVSPNDPETNAPISGGLDYPRVTAQGNTVGYDTGNVASGLQTRDRNSGNDSQLASIHFPVGFGDLRFRFDLPVAGTYNIRSACGDPAYTAHARLEVFDNASSLGVLSSTDTTAANKFRDATDTEYSNAAWPGSNTAVAKTFSTTICRFLFTDSQSVIAHLYLEAVAATAGYLLVKN